MIKQQLDALMKKLDLPETVPQADLSVESALLLKEFGLNVEGASSSEDNEAEGPVAE